MGMLRVMNDAFSTMFGCRHERMSRIFTIDHESYMVCLGCGHRVYYSVESMRRMTRREIKRMQRDHVPAAVASAPVPVPVADDPTLAA